MKIYHWNESAIYIDPMTIKRIIKDISESDVTRSELLDLSFVGTFDELTGSYRYIVTIKNIVHKTVYFTIKIFIHESDLSKSPIGRLFDFIMPGLDTNGDPIDPIRPLRIFRYTVYCPNLKINSRKVCDQI